MVASPRMARETTLADKQGNMKAGARRLAARSMEQLGETKVTPDMLSLGGLGLCIAASVAVYFEYKAWWLYLVGGVLVIVTLIQNPEGVAGTTYRKRQVAKRAKAAGGHTDRAGAPLASDDDGHQVMTGVSG